jgi:1,2-diacylglycerol-3-alpha-glucose alpha-1,2-galactosyltransferase
MGKKIRVNMLSESEFTVQGHGVHTAYVELTAALKKRPDVRVAVNGDVPADITHIQTVGFYAMRRLLFGSGRKVVSAHLVPDSFIGSFAMARHWRPVARWWLRFFYKRADLVLAVSDVVRNELVTNMRLPEDRVKLLYNTIDMGRYKTTKRDKAGARKKLHIQDDDFVVVGNGQIQPRKRFDVFVDLAKQMPEVQFLWIGGIPFGNLGAQYGSMQKLIGKAPPNLRITGVIPLKKVKLYLQSADVFLLPAEQENHPMSVLEAAGVGLPIILRDIPHYEDTFNGFVLLETDDTFAETVRKLRSDERFRRTYESKSRQIAKRFDSKAGAERAVGFYRSLL